MALIQVPQRRLHSHFAAVFTGWRECDRGLHQHEPTFGTSVDRVTLSGG